MSEELNKGEELKEKEKKDAQSASENLHEAELGTDLEIDSEEESAEKMLAQSEVNKIAAREAAKATKSILGELGLKDKKEIGAFMEQFKQFQAAQTEKMTLTEKYEIQSKALVEMEQNYNKVMAQLVEKEQESTLAKLGIPLEDLDYYQIKAQKIVDETGIDFSEAVEEVLKIRPIKQPELANMASGVGKAPISSGITLDEYKKMTYEERLKLKTDNPTLYEKLAKALFGK